MLTKISNSNGDILYDQPGISDEVTSFYQKLYTSRNPSINDIDQYVDSCYLESVPEDMQSSLEAEIIVEELDKVVSNLKNNKSCDHFGMVYELFKPGVIGKDLFNSLLMLCNEVKIQQKIPRFLKYTDITSFYKSKGDRRSLENDRGFFGVMKVRSIIDRLVYNG